MTEPFNRQRKPTGLKRIFRAMGHSNRALSWMLANETAFKQELLLLLATVVIVIIWPISLYEKTALLCAALLLIFAEIVNTAIESVVDRISEEHHPLSGLAKDLGSAAVFIAMVIKLLLWLAIAYTYFT